MEHTINPHMDRPRQGRMDFINRISWSAVFVGVLVAIGTQMLLILLGLGVGLWKIDPMEEQNPMAGLGAGSAVWYVISSLLSLLLGGWVASRTGSKDDYTTYDRPVREGAR